MGGEKLEHVVVRKCVAYSAFATHDLGCRPEGVEHRLLGGVDHGFEHVVEIAVGDVRGRRLPARLRPGGAKATDLAAAVVADRAAARESEAGAPSDALELVRRERASTAATAMQLPAFERRVMAGSPSRSPTGTPSMTRAGGG